MRVMALATGTAGLVGVAVMILALTPRPLDAPIAISATTTAASSALTGGSPAAPVPAAGASTDGPAALAARGVTAAPPTASAPGPATSAVLATPIGDEGLALITPAAGDPDDGRVIEVQLPSGRLDSGEVVGRVGAAWVVLLDHAETGHQLAARAPAAGEMVTVLVKPPVTVAYADIDTLDIAEGVAVLDGDGRLVGLCSRRTGDGRVEVVEVVEVSAELDGTTSDAP